MTARVVDRVNFAVHSRQENFPRSRFRGRHAAFRNIPGSHALLARFLAHHSLDVLAQALSLGGKSHIAFPLILQTIIGEPGYFLCRIFKHGRLHWNPPSMLADFIRSRETAVGAKDFLRPAVAQPGYS